MQMARAFTGRCFVIGFFNRLSMALIHLLSECFDDSSYRYVVRFGTARCEYDLGLFGSYKGSYMITGLVDDAPVFLPVEMKAARVAESRAQERKHRLDDFLSHICSSVMVEIDPPLLSVHFVSSPVTVP